MAVLGVGCVSYERGTPVNVWMWQVAAMALPLIRDVSRPKPETLTPSFRLRLDPLFRYQLNGRIGLALYFPEICADTRAVASRGLKAPIIISVWQVAAMALPLIRDVSRPKPETPKPSGLRKIRSVSNTTKPKPSGTRKRVFE